MGLCLMSDVRWEAKEQTRELRIGGGLSEGKKKNKKPNKYSSVPSLYDPHLAF